MKKTCDHDCLKYNLKIVVYGMHGSVCPGVENWLVCSIALVPLCYVYQKENHVSES